MGLIDCRQGLISHNPSQCYEPDATAAVAAAACLLVNAAVVRNVNLSENLTANMHIIMILGF